MGNELTITVYETSLNLVNEVNELVFSSPGPQGPQGETGLPGGSFYEHSQPTPAGTWTIPHNLGRRVHVSVFDASGTEVKTDVDQASVNTAVLTFGAPFSGSAVLS